MAKIGKFGMEWAKNGLNLGSQKFGEQMNKHKFCPPKIAKMGDFFSSHKPLPNPRGVLHSRNH